MRDHIKLFEEHADYTAYIQSNEFVKPNVSYCLDEETVVHYNPITQPMACVLNVYDYQLQNGARLYSINDITAATFFSKIEIDDVEVSLASLDSNDGRYVFNTAGNHTIKYYFNGIVNIPDFGFNQVKFLSISIPNSVLSIGQSAFSDNEYLETVALPNNSITIGDSAFCEDNLDQSSLNAINAINPNAHRSCHME